MADVSIESEPGLGLMVRRGLARRCPVCGGRTMFSSWFRMRDTCDECGLTFHREHGEVLSAVTLNMMFTLTAMFAVFLAFAVLAGGDVPVGLLAGLTLAIGIIFPLAFYPASRGLWIALDLRLQR